MLGQTLIALAAGYRLDEHDNPGEATVHVLHGRVRLSVGDVGWEGFPADLLIVPAARHTLDALKTPPCCSPWPSTVDTAVQAAPSGQQSDHSTGSLLATASRPPWSRLSDLSDDGHRGFVLAPGSCAEPDWSTLEVSGAVPGQCYVTRGGAAASSSMRMAVGMDSTPRLSRARARTPMSRSR